MSDALKPVVFSGRTSVGAAHPASRRHDGGETDESKKEQVGASRRREGSEAGKSKVQPTRCERRAAGGAVAVAS